MSTDLIARLRAALDSAEQQARAATPGPWEAEHEYRPLPGCRCLSCHEDEPYGMAIHDIDAVGEDSSPILKAEDALYIAAWGPDRALALIARDRALLAAFERADRYVAEHVEQCGEGLCSCREHVTWTATSGALRMVVERAAEFWLGST